MMKKHLPILIVLLMAQSIGLLIAQQDTILVFKGRLDTASTALQTIKPCLLRTERSNSDFGGIIEVQCEAGMSEEMQCCIKVAAQLWEEKLYIPKKVVLKFEKEKMGVGAEDFEAQVRYTSLLGTTKMYSQSYFMNFLSDDKRNVEDAIIKINDDVDWDYSFSGETINKKNLTTAMLRAIAMSLGFGSSVIDNSTKGITFFVRRCFSPFDDFVINSNNVCLNEMPNNGRTSQELVSFVTGNNVYYKTTNNENLKLYASPEFQGYNYLSYFDTTGDLMSYNMRIGDKNQQVDRKTQEVLETIGWKEPEKGLKIVADGIDNTGMASATRGYSFRAEIPSGNIIKYSWKYELLNNEMDYVLIKKGESSEFAIDKVDELAKYRKNVNGDIKGKISLNAIVGGKEVSKVFHVYLSTKPTFISVKVDSITPISGTRYYNLDITVIYDGADYLYVEQSEEFGDIVNTHFYYEPYIAHLRFKRIFMIGMSWVDMELSNNEGKVYYTVQIPNQMELLNHSTLIQEEVINSEIAQIEVRDIQGRIVLRTDNYESVSCLSKGIYIVTLTYTNGKTVTRKMCQ